MNWPSAGAYRRDGSMTEPPVQGRSAFLTTKWASISVLNLGRSMPGLNGSSVEEAEMRNTRAAPDRRPSLHIVPHTYAAPILQLADSSPQGSHIGLSSSAVIPYPPQGLTHEACAPDV